jgi:bifunctional non-homologous end joining protein LigD
VSPLLKVSSPDKILFPKVGTTKGDLVAHYQRVGGRVLEFLGGRPLTLERYANGIDRDGFMLNNVADCFPESIDGYEVPKRDGGSARYPVVTDADDIAWLASQNTVTFHMWTSTAATPHKPDWLVIDLDPAEGDIDGARFATLHMKELFDEFGVDGTPLATGSSGFHVWVALEGTTPTETVMLAARALAGLACNRNPESLTNEFLKEKRAGRRLRRLVTRRTRRHGGGPLLRSAQGHSSRWRSLSVGTRCRASSQPMFADRVRRPTHVALERTAQSVPFEAIIAAARAEGVDRQPVRPAWSANRRLAGPHPSATRVGWQGPWR